MMSNWQTKKLGEICDIKTGKKDVNQGNPNGKYPFFTCAREHTYSDEYSFDMEALLVAGNGDVGHVNYYKGKFEAYQRTYILSDFKNISSRFLHLFLDGFLKDTVSKQKLGNTMPYIKMSMLTEFQIPLPPLPEQQRIVKILDEVFDDMAKAKENAEKNLQNSKELFESYLQSVFANPGEDWEEKRLGDVCDFVRGPFGGSLKKSIFKKEGYIVYEQQHAIYNQFTKVRYFIDENKFNEMKRFELKPGDLIMSCSGTMGKIAIAPDDIKKGIINQALLKLSPSKNLFNVFLKYWMESGVFQDDLNKYTKGAAIKNVVSVKILKGIKLFIPKIQEQKSIVAKLDALSAETKKLEEIYKQKLTDLEELKKSVLKKAFSGEL